jgi:MHS family proline/betaine transporter-like MFS transporter
MTTLARETEQGSVRPSLAKTLFATCIGNALEWFDIAVYGFFASYIAQVFSRPPTQRSRCCSRSAALVSPF